MKTDMTILECKTFEDLYAWFLLNAEKETEVYVVVSRQNKEKCIDVLCYEDAVKAALCFGWIDSTIRNIDGKLVQRLSPRKKNSHWTETNINRCIELDSKGLLTKAGKKACPHYK